MTTTTAPATTTDTGLRLKKLGQHIGARIEGLDLSGPLEEGTVSAIRAALNEHKALVFTDAGISSDAQQEAFAAHFGPLTTAHPTVTFHEGTPKTVLPVDSEESVANQWHTDVTFVINPPQISTLRAVVLPTYGGETLIANTAAAYKSLPRELQHLAQTLWAEHTNASDYIRPRTVQGEKEQQYQQAFVSQTFRTVHPVVRVHPLTGEKGLFIGAFAQRLRILGVSAHESADLLRLLQAHVTRPEHVVRVGWEPGQVVVFDNRITQHYAIDNYDRAPRKLNRITVAGDVPVGVHGQRSHSLEGDSSQYSPIVELP
ncbi:TauD/TfdA family dioxygenase [Kocuria gwangalliensis]|uniref:TauD/TfdA family dioxygenase n=1 Tax=Kocuria gwangalliensis TaxID=501592 RepID=A0ABP8WUW3_9MICC